MAFSRQQVLASCLLILLHVSAVDSIASSGSREDQQQLIKYLWEERTAGGYSKDARPPEHDGTHTRVYLTMELLAIIGVRFSLYKARSKGFYKKNGNL